MLPPPLLVIRIVVQAFENLKIAYLVGGSVASSTYGIYRSTQDVDFVAEIREEHVASLAAAFAAEFYSDAAMIQEAVETRGSFNVLHLATMVKADIFVMQTTPWAREEMARRQPTLLGDDDSYSVYLASPEDMILQKLVWYRMGGGVSDRQWNDIQGMLKVQANGLDFAYLHRWAGVLGVSDFLTRAEREAGIPGAE